MPKTTKKRLASSSKTQPASKHTRQAASNLKTKQLDRASKQSRVIAILQSPNGATTDAMMKATRWQQHSVRGFLTGVVRKRLKLKLESHVVDGTRLYRIVDASAKPIETTKTKRPHA